MVRSRAARSRSGEFSCSGIYSRPRQRQTRTLTPTARAPACDAAKDSRLPEKAKSRSPGTASQQQIPHSAAHKVDAHFFSGIVF